MRPKLGKLALVTLMILDMTASLGHVLRYHDLEMDHLIRITKLLIPAITIVTPTLRTTTTQIPIYVLVVASFHTVMFRISGLNRNKWRRTALHRYP